MEYDDNAEFEDLLYDDTEEQDTFDDGYEEVDYDEMNNSDEDSF